ncbi:aminoglycoside 3-N-acetyltransferase [Micromonospora rhizosphaerae]|uniref:Aminoglycoside N(3)-acetyltransferase n=1 Tax=Micromonospora rhizosphaerae TaxID=568872 RepID=A0A1C6SB99_9ACTN|nr:AAC(3) family N-acetyltransferase [Micromonospora rhizosphaerae]SCL26708.1 aminoglycoside 3-N-acetyltransferase [Micromonospora rhizosphaerae]
MSAGLAEMAAGFAAIGATGRPVCVHSSLRSFGRLDGGPTAIVEAVLAGGGTLMVSTWSGGWYATPPPPGRSRPDNAEDDGSVPTRPAQHCWDPSSPYVHADAVGALAATVVAHPDRRRGDHPLNSFTAVGPLAATLVAGQAPLDVYAPLRALAAHDGLILCMGTGLTSVTAIHLAEQRAGRQMFRRWALTRAGVVECEVGSCSRGFDRLAPMLEPLARRVTVDGSAWTAYPAGPLVARAAAALVADRGAARCRYADCRRCAVMTGGVVVPSPALPPELTQGAG